MGDQYLLRPLHVYSDILIYLPPILMVSTVYPIRARYASNAPSKYDFLAGAEVYQGVTEGPRHGGQWTAPRRLDTKPRAATDRPVRSG
jgi:hypothetical protein